MFKFYSLFITLFVACAVVNAQPFNPFVSTPVFIPAPTASGFLCGSTVQAQFNAGLTTASNANLWQTNPLTIVICLTGFEFTGSPASVVSGSYAGNFNWAFDNFSPNCIVGTQNQPLIGTGPNSGSPNPSSLGTILLTFQTPINTSLNMNLGVSVNLQLPGYMTGNVQVDDNLNLASFGTCSCYSFLTNAGSIAGNQTFFQNGNPAAFTSVNPGSGGTGTIEYQWQQLSGSNWIDISAATALTYDAPSISQTTSYRRKGKRSSCGTWVNSNVVTVSILTPDAGPDKIVTCTNPTASIGTAPIAGITYSWAPSAGLNDASLAQPVASPLASTAYTLTVTEAGGSSASDVVFVTVDKTPPPLGTTISASTICAGSASTITGTGAVDYYWMPGDLMMNPISVSPTTTTTYTVTGTGSNGCTNTATRTVTVNPAPPVGSTATASTICAGSSTTLTGTGATIYTWNFGASYTPSLTVSPSSTTTYAVIGTNSATGCTALSLRTIFVNQLPVITTSASPSSICPSASSTLSASGASTYLWQPGNASGSSVIVSPQSTTTYTVTGSSAAGCSRTSTRTITVVPCGSTLNLTLFIEGYYNNGAGTMEPVLTNQGVQNVSPAACDSITIELRNSAQPYAMAASVKTMLNRNGTATANFTQTGDYYIVIKHRNALETWSALPLSFTSGNISYNFSSSASQAFGNRQVEVGTGIYAFYSGEINRDENIDLLDLSLIESDITSFQFGYHPTDINGDGNVDLLDTPIVESNVSSFIFSVHP